MFVLRKGNYETSPQEYSYARRAQSTVKTLQWRDVATVNTDDIDEAISISKTAIAEWAKQKFTAERWCIEGRGTMAGYLQEIQLED